jgi:hypothetical protein
MILFNIFILSWLLTHFTPLKILIDIIPIKKLNALFSLLISIIILPFSCMMCMSFWIGLIWTHSIITAATVSFIGYIWSHIEKRLEYERF